MKKRIVIALGGNAILDKDASEIGQIETIRDTVKSIMSLDPSQNEIVITHGNGPQVGNLLLQQIFGSSENNPPLSLNTCVSMTQGSIGNWLQNEITNEMNRKKLNPKVVVIPTRVLVSSKDQAFIKPEKPIGPFYKELVSDDKENHQYKFFEDRGWRRVVASPAPLEILEIDAIEKMLENGYIVICGGGGGSAYVRDSCQKTLIPTDCVIDKDLVAEKIATNLKADMLIILTGVNNVYLNYKESNETILKKVSVEKLREYIETGMFESGTILPKVKAAVNFINNNPSSQVVITSLENVREISKREVGTIVVSEL